MDTSINKLKKDHADAMAKIQFDLLVTKLKADGFTDAEYKMALAAGVALGQIDQASADTASAMSQITDAALVSGKSMEEMGALMQGVLADGVISAQELQAALLALHMPTLAYAEAWQSPAGGARSPVGCSKTTRGWLK